MGVAAKVDLKPWLRARLGKRIEVHGDEWGLPCPECDVGRAKEWRLWFNVVRNVGTCYKCHRPFNTVTLVQVLEGVSFAEAVRLVKEHTVGGVLSLAMLKQHVEQAFTETEDDEPQVELPPLDLPEGFRACANEPQKRWPPYVLDRIGAVKTVLNYGIGWCSTGYYRNRLIVPVTSKGQVVSFVARDMTGRAERKVLYPKGTRTSHMLFNYDRASRFHQVVLVEGVLDALRVGPRCMALFGTSLSRAQAQLLAWAPRVREVVLMLDGDAAGEAGTRKLVERLRSGFRLKVVRLRAGTDPDDYHRPALRAMVEGAPYLGRGRDLASHVRAALGPA